MKRAMLGVLLAASAGAGCAGAVPRERLASSEAAIRAAEQVGAERVPGAEYHLALARRELAAAKDLIEDGHRHRADRLLLRAEADADLALTLAREEPTHRQAEQAAARLEALRAGQKF